MTQKDDGKYGDLLMLNEQPEDSKAPGSASEPSENTAPRRARPQLTMRNVNHEQREMCDGDRGGRNNNNVGRSKNDIGEKGMNSNDLNTSQYKWIQESPTRRETSAEHSQEQREATRDSDENLSRKQTQPQLQVLARQQTGRKGTRQ